VSLITGLTYFIIRCTGTMRKALRCNLRRCWLSFCDAWRKMCKSSFSRSNCSSKRGASAWKEKETNV